MPTAPATLSMKSDTSVRILKYSAVVGTGVANTSTFLATYVKLPPSSSPWLQQVFGVVEQDFLDPNQFFTQGIDYTTVNGVAWTSPYVGAGVGKNIMVAIKGITWVYAAGTVAAGDLLLPADAFGGVNNPTNLSIAGSTKVFPVGIAQKPATAKTLVEVELYFEQTTT